MNRRQVLAIVGVGASTLAGCLSDRPRSSGPPSNETDAAPSLDALSNQCPYTEVSPPSTLTESEVRAFVEASEADYAMEHQSVLGLQHTGVVVETVHIADGVARVDAELFLTDGGVSGEATVYPVGADDESGADDADAEGDENGADDADDTDADDPVSTSADAFAEATGLLEAVEGVLEDGRSRTVNDEASLRAVLSEGSGERSFVLEHDGEYVRIDHDADEWVGHDQEYVGYRISEDGVFRTTHAPGDWRERTPGAPVSVSDAAWAELGCWS